MSKIKNGGLDQYGIECFEQQQLGTAGVDGVKKALKLLGVSECSSLVIPRTDHQPRKEIFEISFLQLRIYNITSFLTSLLQELIRR